MVIPGVGHFADVLPKVHWWNHAVAARRGPGCHELTQAETRTRTIAGVATSPHASSSSRRSPDACTVANGVSVGSRCGCACPVAGSPARTTHQTGTQAPTIGRPTILSRLACPVAHASGGVSSTAVLSDPWTACARGRGGHAAPSRNRRLDASISASASARPAQAAPSTLLPGSRSL